MPKRIGLFVVLAMLALPAQTLAARPNGASTSEPSVRFEYPSNGDLTYGHAGVRRIRWTESGTDRDAAHRLVRKSAPVDRLGGCAGRDYAKDREFTVAAPPEGATASVDVSGHKAARCYRYELVVERPTTDDFVSRPSGILRVVTKWDGAYDMYRSGTFSTQKTYTWCVAASVQMMRNLILYTESHSRRQQRRFQSYAQNNDRIPDGVSPGSDPQGWAAALRRFTGVSSYGWHATSSYGGALRHAAKRLRRTGQPVGLLLARGGHAWVMTGFQATADPAMTNDFQVTHVFVSGPLYPMQQSNGYDRPPDTRLSVSTLASYFVRFRGIERENSMIWDQLYVTVTP